MSAEVEKILTVFRDLCDGDKQELADALAIEMNRSGERPSLEVIRSIRGKYSHLPNSSEAFMARKREEVELER